MNHFKTNAYQGLFLAIFSLVIHFGIAVSESKANPTNSANQGYIFSPEKLNAINLQAIDEIDGHFKEFVPTALQQLAADYYNQPDANHPELTEALRAETINDRIHQILQEQYPNEIISNPKWVWNNVGGVYARIKILYCSLNEYIALFGTTIPQSGFSGEYPNMEVYDIMTTGKMRGFNAPAADAFPTTYKPGDISILTRNETTYYSMDKYTYMIDYGRGNITPSLWQGVISPFLFVNHDSNSAYTQLSECGKSVLNHLANKFIRK